MKHTVPALIGLAATALVTALVTTPAQAAPVCDAALIAPQGSLIGGFWRSNNGPNSVFGCPTTKELGFPGKRGSAQRFQHGKIVWSPALGEGTLVRAFRSGTTKVVFKWSGLGRDWDFFNVRWSKDGGSATQVKVTRLTPWSGQFTLTPNNSGDVASTTNGGEVNRYAFIVQGCDRGTFSSDCGPWSIVTSADQVH